MRIFLSWSGELSHKVALELYDWLPQVIQLVEPFISSESIEKGTRWGGEIAQNLGSLDVGILCLTRENVNAPWLNFEAGSLAKSLEESRVMPFLFAMERSEVTWPLAQFQSTIFDKEDVRKMLLTINRLTQGAHLEDRIINRSFERWWPELQSKLDNLATQAPLLLGDQAKLNPRHNDEILEEILQLVRSQERSLGEVSLALLAERPHSRRDDDFTRAASFQGMVGAFNKVEEILADYEAKRVPLSLNITVTYLRRLVTLFRQMEEDAFSGPPYDDRPRLAEFEPTQRPGVTRPQVPQTPSPPTSPPRRPRPVSRAEDFDDSDLDDVPF